MFWALFIIFDFLGPKIGVARRPPICVGGLNAQPKNQKVDSLGGPFGYTII